MSAGAEAWFGKIADFVVLETCFGGAFDEHLIEGEAGSLVAFLNLSAVAQSSERCTVFVHKAVG